MMICLCQEQKEKQGPVYVRDIIGGWVVEEARAK